MMTLAKYAKVIQRAQQKSKKNTIYDSLAPNQIASKQWLVEELAMLQSIYSQPIHAEIVGSWHFYPLMGMLEEKFNIGSITGWDIDFDARMIARTYLDVFKPPYEVILSSKNYWYHNRHGSKANLLINTSSEHMRETFDDLDESFMFKHGRLFFENKPIVAIQSNNMRNIGEHINCVDSEDELINTHKIKEIYYQGTRDMVEWVDNEIKSVPGGYKRFMVIGKI